ncbi:hypothetical protein M0R72_16415 [Candidatus Pacearchaeota archaeon]|nr:hypothetical protein [Candidatus Pacearchaeota archaeon]
MDFDDIYRFLIVFIATSAIVFGMWFGYFYVQQHYLELALRQAHVRYHLEHKDDFKLPCSYCGTHYAKTDITLSENDNACSDE